MLLGSARRAYNEKNYPFAAERFREFLSKYGNHKEANSARYGLALCLIDGPSKDYNAAIQQLQPLAGDKNLSEHPFVLYYLGLSQRGLGTQALAHGARQTPGSQSASQYGPATIRRGEQAVRRRCNGLLQPYREDRSAVEADADRAGMGRARPLRSGRDVAASAQGQGSAGPRRSVSYGRPATQESLSGFGRLLSRFRLLPPERQSRRWAILEPVNSLHRSGIRHARSLFAGPRPSRLRRTPGGAGPL